MFSTKLGGKCAGFLLAAGGYGFYKLKDENLNKTMAYYYRQGEDKLREKYFGDQTIILRRKMTNQEFEAFQKEQILKSRKMFNAKSEAPESFIHETGIGRWVIRGTEGIRFDQRKNKNPKSTWLPMTESMIIVNKYAALDNKLDINNPSVVEVEVYRKDAFKAPDGTDCEYMVRGGVKPLKSRSISLAELQKKENRYPQFGYLDKDGLAQGFGFMVPSGGYYMSSEGPSKFPHFPPDPGQEKAYMKYLKQRMQSQFKE